MTTYVAPRVTLPTGLTYNATTDEVEGTVMDTSMALSGTRVNVPDTGNAATNGSNLLAAIAAWTRGQMIVLDSGVNYDINAALIVPALSAGGTAWSSLVSSAVANGTFPRATGERMQTTDTAALAHIRFVGIDTAMVYTTASQDCSYFRVEGIRFAGRASATVSDIIRLGTSDTQTSLSQMPRRFLFRHCWINADDGDITTNRRNGISPNCAYFAFEDGRIDGLHTPGTGVESHCIVATNSPGPFKIINNHLGGASITIMFGGATPAIAGLIPADLEYRRNYSYTVNPNNYLLYGRKNCFELKFMQRALVEGCLFDGSWQETNQNGFAINLKSSAGISEGEWTETANVWVRHSHILHAGQGFSLSPMPDGPCISMHDVQISDVLLEHLNEAPYTTNGGCSAFAMGVGHGDYNSTNNHIDNLAIEHCTVVGPNTERLFAVNGPDLALADRPRGFKFKNNVLESPSANSGFRGNTTAGVPSMNATLYTDYDVAGNLWGGVEVANYPTTDTRLATVAELQALMTNYASGNYSLAVDKTSVTTDGEQPGVHFARFTALTAATATGLPGTQTADHLALSEQPAGAVSGLALTTQPSGTVQDNTNATVTSDTSTVSVAWVSLTGDASLSGTTSVSASAGAWGFTNLALAWTVASTGYFAISRSGLATINTNTLTLTVAPPPDTPERTYPTLTVSDPQDTVRQQWRRRLSQWHLLIL